MKNLIKMIALIIVLLINGISLYGQNADKVVTLTTTGEGKTKQDAISVALRNAIEQAFGTFISSKTEILNDNLIKDEIISVSNGNIQKYEILAEGQLPSGEYYNSVKATVSVSKLTSFCESKGINVEFKGSLFAFNIKQQMLNEENELKAIENMAEIIKKIAHKSFNYKIEAGQPTQARYGWAIPIRINIAANPNFNQIGVIFNKTLSGLSMSKEETLNYKQVGKKTYRILFAYFEKNDGIYYILRNPKSVEATKNIILGFNSAISDFKITNGTSTFTIYEKWEQPDGVYIPTNKNQLSIEDKNFLILPKKAGQRIIGQSLFHYYDRSYVLLKPQLADIKTFMMNKMVAENRRINNLFIIDQFTKYELEKYKPLDADQFDFLRNGILDNFEDDDEFHLVVSLNKIAINDYNMIKVTFLDFRSLDEINQITEYKIITDAK